MPVAGGVRARVARMKTGVLRNGLVLRPSAHGLTAGDNERVQEAMTDRAAPRADSGGGGR